MGKKAFTTSEIANISHHSRETVKRWLEKGALKGYRVGTSGHWRVLPKDLAIFLAQNHIPFPEPSVIGVDLKALSENRQHLPTFCWEFFRNKMDDHVRSKASCQDCIVYKVKAINCHGLRQEVEHKKIYCRYSCEDCTYFQFQKKQILPDT
jgi:excisionase family DNA binding protein